MPIIISLISFFVIFLGLCVVIWFKRIANARKLIREHAEAKGWKVIKIKLDWWDFVLTYQDEAGINAKLIIVLILMKSYGKVRQKGFS